MQRIPQSIQVTSVFTPSAADRSRARERVSPEEKEGGWDSDRVGPVHGIRVGTGGWTYAPWRGNFYPDGLVQRRELEFASRHLSSIEINGTFYSAQAPATYARWRDETPDDFLFSMKAPKRIVQSRTLEKTASQVEDFIGGIEELGKKLGPLVWQFAPGLKLERETFAEFCTLLPKSVDGRALRHVLDVRVPDFVDAEFLALARGQGHALAYTDSPDHPSFADVSANFVYARLMCSRAELATGYPAQELDAWAARARAWARGAQPGDLARIDPAPPARTPREVFIYFIGAAKERNPAAAMALLERLGAR